MILYLYLRLKVHPTIIGDKMEASRRKYLKDLLLVTIASLIPAVCVSIVLYVMLVPNFAGMKTEPGARGVEWIFIPLANYMVQPWSLAFVICALFTLFFFGIMRIQSKTSAKPATND